MSAPEFLDTNVLVYAYNAGTPQKQSTAREIVRRALLGHGVISTQVLTEFSAAMLHKVSPPVRSEQVLLLLDALAPARVIATDGDMIRRAVETRSRYGVHFYDGMIIAAAERAKCGVIWSEDLNPGQEYFGVRVVNPFI